MEDTDSYRDIEAWGDDEGDPLAYGRWSAATNSALLGKRGKHTLRELEAVLLALPRKRLLWRTIAQDGDVCPLAALAAARIDAGQEVYGLSSRAELERFSAHYGDDFGETLRLGEALGLNEHVAYEISATNDLTFDREYIVCERHKHLPPLRPFYYPPGGTGAGRPNGCWRTMTPERRYEAVLGWVRAQIATPHPNSKEGRAARKERRAARVAA